MYIQAVTGSDAESSLLNIDKNVKNSTTKCVVWQPFWSTFWIL